MTSVNQNEFGLGWLSLWCYYYNIKAQTVLIIVCICIFILYFLANSANLKIIDWHNDSCTRNLHHPGNTKRNGYPGHIVENETFINLTLCNYIALYLSSARMPEIWECCPEHQIVDFLNIIKSLPKAIISRLRLQCCLDHQVVDLFQDSCVNWLRPTQPVV